MGDLDKNEEQFFGLSALELEGITSGLDDLRSGRTILHDDVKIMIDKKIEDYICSIKTNKDI